jgi:hypothetical protein
MKGFILAVFVALIPCFAQADDPVFFSKRMRETHIQSYTDEEQATIAQDLAVVRGVCFSNQKTHAKPIYLATAGGPGARKTTILERALASNSDFANCVYLDPDQRGLKFMLNTYVSRSLANIRLAEFEHYTDAQKAAYEKWRGASNWIALTLLEEAFAQKKDIAYGTTSTGGHMAEFFPKVKQAGYEIVLLLCYAPDDVRQKAVEYRNEEQKFFQSTPQDVISKGKAFPERMPVYFAHADTLYLYWSDDYSSPERVGAVLKDGVLQILDSTAYKSFVKKYEKDRETLSKEGKSIPSWAQLLDIYNKR